MTILLVEVKSFLVISVDNRCRAAASMTVSDVEDVPATFKLFVWQHIGHLVEIINGNRVTGKNNM